MRTTIRYFLMAGMALAVLAAANAADSIPVPETAPAGTEAAARELRQAERRAARQALQAERQAERRAARQEANAAGGTARAAASVEPVEIEEPSLRLNFRGVALDVVLDYLSDAAGYTIVLETPVKGTVDVWSNHPLTRAEALDLINSALNKNGYAAIQNGKTLTVVSREDARRRDIPIRIGSSHQNIPKNDQMVTQVLPVRNINVTQLARDLAPLIPASASVVANEGGNTLVVTDTQANIHRLAELVSALDSQVSSASMIKVYALRYADAKQLAATITSLFQNAGTTGTAGGNRGGGGGGFPGFGGFGGGGGRGGGGGGGAEGGGGAGGGGNNNANSVAIAVRVTAVSDEHSNSLIVSASETQFPGIELLIRSVDTDVQDLTEVRVFHLRNADPVEMSELLASLFPATTQDETRGGGVRFGGGFGGPGGGGGRQIAATAESERSKKQGRVLAVADPRTRSLVVSAAREIMPQISEMVMQLDNDPSKKKRVFVYDLENANVQEVETVLRGLFETQNTRGRATTTQNNALQDRANRANQNQIGPAVGNTGLGGGGGLGGGNR